MHIRIRFSALRESHWYEYVARFLLGGLATVLTGIMAMAFGPVVGGLFLAFPAIIPAAATLVEKHERERKQAAGVFITHRGRDVAALEAMGAALGSFGLMAFGAVIWLTIPFAQWLSPLIAVAAWILVALLAWQTRRLLRRARSRKIIPHRSSCASFHRRS